MSKALDVLIVSLGSTGGLRAVDEELLGSLRRAGATATIAAAEPPPPVRTLMLTDLRWARAARSAALAELRRARPRALIYSTTTAALLWPRPGAIRFDAPAAANRRGRHGLWQRPLERRRLREASLLLPQSEGALADVPTAVRRSLGTHGAIVLPVPVEPSGPQLPSGPSKAPVSHESCGPSGGRGARDVTAITYAANPAKKGLDTVLDAWRRAHRPGEAAAGGRRRGGAAAQARIRASRRGGSRNGHARARRLPRALATRASARVRGSP